MKNSQTYFYFLYVKLAAVHLRAIEQIPHDLQLFKVSPFGEKLFRESSAEKVISHRKQTPPTNKGQLGSQITEPISAWRVYFRSPPDVFLGEICACNLQSALVFRNGQNFLVLVYFLEAFGAKWERQEKKRPLESKLKGK